MADRRRIIIALAVIAAVSLSLIACEIYTDPSAGRGGPGCRLIVFGHLYSLEPYPGLQRLLVEHVNAAHPDASAVISLGDNTIHGTAEEWEDFFRVYDNLRAPMYFAPGNHDVRNPDALGNYMEYVGYTSGQFKIADCNLIMVNTVNHEKLGFDDLEMMKGGGLDEASVALLSGLGQAAPGEANILFMHHSLHSIGLNTARDGLTDADGGWNDDMNRTYENEKTWRKTIQPLIKDRIDAVYVGDWFNAKISRMVIDGIPYIANSLSCDFDPGPISSRRPLSYTIVDVSGTGEITTEIGYLPIPIDSGWFDFDRNASYQGFADDFDEDFDRKD